MTIYELIKDSETSEIKALGHVDPFEFKKKIKFELGIDVNIGDIKQGWEAMRFEKPGIYFKRCNSSEFGANPVTFVRLECD